MKKRHAVVRAQVLGFLLLVCAAVVALNITACRSEGEQEPGAVSPRDAETRGGGLDCPDLVTPDHVGREAFERYRIGEKLLDDGFTRQEEQGIVVCSYASEEAGESTPTESLDLSYTFDGETAQLLLSSIVWLAAPPEPGPTPSPEPEPTEVFEILTVCLDADTPLIEIEGEYPESWAVWDILAAGGCSKEITGPICWDCGEDVTWHWLVPAGTEESSGKACIDARTAAAVGGLELEEGEVASLTRDRCSLQLGTDQVCWHCRLANAGPSPIGSTEAPAEEATQVRPPEPEPVQADATRASASMPALGCQDYVTPDVIGQEAWQRYGIADLLQHDTFQRHLSELDDTVACTCDRALDGVTVVGDLVQWVFDRGSGALLTERIHWRGDLDDFQPPALISKQEAEALVVGSTGRSSLALFGPDTWPFQFDKAAFGRPCWLVSTGVASQEQPVTMVIVVDAMSGEVLGKY